jgi:hypothetical protein
MDTEKDMECDDGSGVVCYPTVWFVTPAVLLWFVTPCGSLGNKKQRSTMVDVMNVEGTEIGHCCQSDIAQQALHLATLMKHNKMRKESIVNRLTMPVVVQDKFYLEYDELRCIMDSIMQFTLPPNTEFVRANEFNNTRIQDVFWNKCMRRNCICDDKYSFLDYGGSRKNNNLTWRQIESLLFVVDMHQNILDMSEKFVECVVKKCKEERKRFPFGAELKTILSKQRKRKEIMLEAIHSVSSRGRVLWAKVRRRARMRNNAHMLWEYKYGPCAAQVDVLSQGWNIFDASMEQP